MTGTSGEAMVVGVLGRVAIVGPLGIVEVSGRQPATVVAHLALEPRGATRDELADVLWGSALSGHWQGALRGVLSKVRRAMAEAGFDGAVVRSDDTVVRLDVDVLETDLTQIERLVDDEAATAEQLAGASSALARPFLPHDDSEWGRRTRARIAALDRRTVQRRAIAFVDGGQIDQATAVLRRAIDADGLDESAAHLLIQTLLDDGQRVAASDMFDTLTTRLAHELGVAPAPATADLFRRADVAAHPTARPRPAASTTARPWSPIHPHTDDPFAGRARELELLRRIRSEVASTGRPHLVVIEGPAGMGKTRLVDQFCSELRRDDVVDHIVWGRNRGTVDRAYGALGEAIARLLAEQPAIAARLGDRLAGLRPLLPGRSSSAAGSGGADDQDGDAAARAGIAASLRILLETLVERPTVWFADDLHWATSDALGTLEEAIDGLTGPLLVIATSRHLSSDVATGLASLQRIVQTTSIRLDGLSVDDVADLFADRGLAREVQHRTAGLPFYASEIARAVRQNGGSIDPASVPDAIADWVSRRVAALDSDVGHTLRLASVIDDEIDVDLLTKCSAHASPSVARIIDTLVASGLLTSAAEPGSSARVQFSHRITRDVVYDDIGPVTRAVLHRHVAETMEARLDEFDDSDPDHAALAHHYSLAGDAVRVPAWRHAMLAGREAMRRGAWVAAERQFDRAVQRATGPRTLGHAIVGRGRALHAQQRFDEARATLFEALDLARTEGLAVVTATATLALVGRAGRGASLTSDDDEHVRLLRVALDALHGADNQPAVDAVAGTGRPDELRCALECELALSLLLSDAIEERSRLLRHSVERARGLRPLHYETLANSLLGSRYAKLGPDQLLARLADIDEVLAMPARSIDNGVRLAAYCYRHEDLLRLGLVDDADSALEQAEQLAERFPHPYWTWAIRTWRALMHIHRGDLGRAEAAVAGAAAMRPQVAEAAACHAVNLVDIRLYQGRAAEMIPALAAATVGNPRIPAYRAVLALCAAEAGDLRRAGGELRWFADAGFENLPDDTNRFLALGVLAHVAATARDAVAGALLTERLLPYEHQWVVLQCYGGGGATWGPAAHGLARLAALDGRPDAAVRLYDRALTLAAGAPLVLQRIEHDRAADFQAGSEISRSV